MFSPNQYWSIDGLKRAIEVCPNPRKREELEQLLDARLADEEAQMKAAMEARRLSRLSPRERKRRGL